MKAKKIFLGVLTVFTALFLTACGDDLNDASDDTADLIDADRVQEADLEIYITPTANLEWVEEGVAIYNQRFGTNITLSPVDISPSLPMVQKITPMLVANETMPDIIFLQDDFSATIMNQFEERFHSVEDYGFIEEHGHNFIPQKLNLLRSTSPTGKVNGFPLDIGVVLMYVNYDLWQEAGIDILSVTTWDEMIEAGIQLKEATGSYMMNFNEVGEADFIKFITESQGVTLLDEHGNVNILDPAVIRAYDLMQQILDAGIVQLGSDINELSQEAGMLLQGSWYTRRQMFNFPDDSGDWRIMSIPLLEAGAESHTAIAGGSSFYVPRNSENALAALQVMSFIMTDIEVQEVALNLMLTPSFMPAYDSQASQMPFPYYGDEPLLNVKFENMMRLNYTHMFPYTTDLDNFMQDATFQIWEGADVIDALENVASDFATRYSLDINHMD